MATYIKVQRADELYHYGTKERSGRYAWGSGDRPYQRLEGKNGGVFRRKRKDTESIREINKKATAKIKGKTDEEYEKERTQEAYDYFKKKRQEKNDEERPMSKIVRDSAAKAKKIPPTKHDVPKKEPEKEEKEAEKEGFDNAAKSVRETLNANKKSANDDYEEYKNNKKSGFTKQLDEDLIQRDKSKQAETKSKEDDSSSDSERDERDLRTDRDSSQMSTKELIQYNTRRKQAEQYEKYRRQDNPTGIDLASDLIKGAKSVHEGVDSMLKEKYDRQRKAEKKARVDAELAQMSDEELRKRVQRLQWEKQYRDLSPEVIIEGEAQIRKIMSIIGTSLKVADMAMPALGAVSGSLRKRR